MKMLAAADQMAFHGAQETLALSLWTAHSGQAIRTNPTAIVSRKVPLRVSGHAFANN